MRRLNFNSKKRAQKRYKKIILYSQSFITNPLNHIFDFLHKKGFFLFNLRKTNISFFQNVGFLFFMNRLHTLVKAYYEKGFNFNYRLFEG